MQSVRLLCNLPMKMANSLAYRGVFIKVYKYYFGGERGEFTPMYFERPAEVHPSYSRLHLSSPPAIRRFQHASNEHEPTNCYPIIDLPCFTSTSLTSRNHLSISTMSERLTEFAEIPRQFVKEGTLVCPFPIFHFFGSL